MNLKALELFAVNQLTTKSSTNTSQLSSENRSLQLLEKTIEILEKELEEQRAENKRLTEQLINLSSQVSSTLQVTTQTYLADKLIEGRRVNEDNVKEQEYGEVVKKKKIWKFWN